MGTVRYTVIDGEVIAEKRNGVRKQYVPDPLGSTVALLDNTQAQTDTFSYWPYGEDAGRTGTTPTPFQYVGTRGQYHDSNTRDYARARELDKQKGRWLTQDPIGFQGRDYNLYRYVVGSPLVFIDPSGLSLCCWHILGNCFGTCCHGDRDCPSVKQPPKSKPPAVSPKPPTGPPQLPPSVGGPISSPGGGLAGDACNRIVGIIREGMPISGTIGALGPILSGSTNGQAAIDLCKQAADQINNDSLVEQDKKQYCLDCCRALLAAANNLQADSLLQLCEKSCLKVGV